MSARLHADAVVDLLTAAGLSTTASEAPDDAAAPFVVVYPSPGLSVAEALGDPIRDLVTSFQLTCVGTTAEQALWASDKARGAINRVTPTITGRDCWPIWSDDPPQPVRRDDAVNPPMFVAISLWSLRSSPST